MKLFVAFWTQWCLAPRSARRMKFSIPHWRARVRGLPGDTPTCTLMGPGACKIRRGCNVLHVPSQNYTFILFSIKGTKAGSHPLRGGSKFDKNFRSFRDLSYGPVGPGSRFAWRNAAMYVKIRRGCNVLQVSFQNYTFIIFNIKGTKAGSHPLRVRSKLWWHVFGPSLGMIVGNSALQSSSATWNPSIQPTNQPNPNWLILIENK